MKRDIEKAKDEFIAEEIRKLKDKDQLRWNITLQKYADLCLRYRYYKFLLPGLVDSFETAMNYDVPGLPFKTKIYKKNLEIHKWFYAEQKLLMSNRDIWFNPVKKEGLMDELKYRRALEKLDFLIQLLAEYGGLQEAKGFVEEGMEAAI